MIFVTPEKGVSAVTEFNIGFDFSSVEAFKRQTDENERNWVFRIQVGNILTIPCETTTCSSKVTVPALKEDQKIVVTFVAVKDNQKIATTRTIEVAKNTENKKSALLEKLTSTKELLNTLSTAEV